MPAGRSSCARPWREGASSPPPPSTRPCSSWAARAAFTLSRSCDERGAERAGAFPPPYVGEVRRGSMNDRVGVDEGAGPGEYQRSPPPTGGGIGWGVDE